MAAPDVSIAIVGSGGAGVLTAGGMLLEAASAAGWHGLLTRSVGPQIRGGEAAALVRLATHPVECLPDRFDLLIGIDWLNAQRFDAEIPLGPDSLVISDPRGGDRRRRRRRPAPALVDVADQGDDQGEPRGARQHDRARDRRDACSASTKRRLQRSDREALRRKGPAARRGQSRRASRPARDAVGRERSASTRSRRAQRNRPSAG